MKINTNAWLTNGVIEVEDNNYPKKKYNKILKKHNFNVVRLRFFSVLTKKTFLKLHLFREKLWTWTEKC